MKAKTQSPPNRLRKTKVSPTEVGQANSGKSALVEVNSHETKLPTADTPILKPLIEALSEDAFPKYPYRNRGTDDKDYIKDSNSSMPSDEEDLEDLFKEIEKMKHFKK